MSKFSVGDKVVLVGWARNDEGVVTAIDYSHEDYPVEVTFDWGVGRFTPEGQIIKGDVVDLFKMEE